MDHQLYFIEKSKVKSHKLVGKNGELEIQVWSNRNGHPIRPTLHMNAHDSSREQRPKKNKKKLLKSYGLSWVKN